MSAVRLLESIVRTMKKQLADHTAEHEAVRLQLAASKDAYDELESRHNDTLAALATVQGERDRLAKRQAWLEQGCSLLIAHVSNTIFPMRDAFQQAVVEWRQQEAALAQPAAQEVKE